MEDEICFGVYISKNFAEGKPIIYEILSYEDALKTASDVFLNCGDVSVKVIKIKKSFEEILELKKHELSASTDLP